MRIDTAVPSGVLGNFSGQDGSGFPDGQLDWDGPMLDAIGVTARREALEEVGLVLDEPIVHVESHTFAIDDERVLDLVVLARSESGDAVIHDPDEVAELAWMTVDELRADRRVQPWTLAGLDLIERKRLALGR